jgi:YidC/Oxa1 family membrane protein insertase
MFSIHSYLRKNALDNYDTIFCVGQHHIDEINESEKIYNLKPKKLVKYGFGRLDTLLDEKKIYENSNTMKKNLIIIAPSYGENNLLHRCGIKLIDILLKSNFQIILRPHFRTIKESKSLIDLINKNFGKNPNFILEKGIIPFDSLYTSKCMISDWSGISLEYAFTFEKPVIFLDVPKKILNPDFTDIKLEPIEISIREKIGYVVSTNNLEIIPKLLNEYETLISNFDDEIKNIRSKTVFNIQTSAKVGGEYILQLISEN